MPGHGPDGQIGRAAIGIGRAGDQADVVQFGQVVDVDDAFGLGDPQPHHRDQAVPAGDQPRLRPVPLQQFEGLFDAVRPGVVDGGGCLHARPFCGDRIASGAAMLPLVDQYFGMENPS